MPLESTSGVYRPVLCCEACVFGKGTHAAWCWPCPGCQRRLYLWDEMQLPVARKTCLCGAIIRTANRLKRRIVPKCALTSGTRP